MATNIAPHTKEMHPITQLIITVSQVEGSFPLKRAKADIQKVASTASRTLGTAASSNMIRSLLRE